MFSLIKIYNKNYWKSIFGPILTFVIPVIIVFLFLTAYNLHINSTTSIAIGELIIPAIIFLTMYLLSLLILPQSIFELKNSIFSKMLVASSIKPWKIPIAGILFYSVLNIITVFISLASVLLCCLSSTEMLDITFFTFRQINWLDLIYVIFINLITAMSFGAMMGMVCKSVSVISLVGTLIVFLSIVLAGFLTPICLVPSQHPSLWYISYIDFVRYPVTSAFEAIYSKASTFNVYGSSIFDFSTPYYAQLNGLTSYPFLVLTPVDKILNMTVPYGVFAICTSVILLRRETN